MLKKTLFLLLLYGLLPIITLAQPNHQAAEYFFDTDTGFGNGIPLVVSTAVSIDENYTIDISGLSSGVHQLYVRTQDANGRWSQVSVTEFYKPFGAGSPPLSPPNFVQAEYFFDIDPGFGNGYQLTVAAANAIDENYTLDISGLTSGVHQLYIRTQDVNGFWSQVSVTEFYKPFGQSAPPPSPPNFVKAEYFFDTDPGFGNGIALDISSANAVDENYSLDISSLTTGMHQLYVRTQDENRNWSMVSISDFERITIPVCLALPDIAQNCSNDNDGIYGTGTDTDGDYQFEDAEYAPLPGTLLTVYNNNFGAPSCGDDANVIIEQQYQLIETPCGIQIKRRYRATDIVGNISAWVVQNIAFSSAPAWQVTFPANVTIDCSESFPAPDINMDMGRCNSLAAEIIENMTTNSSGTPRLERTFRVVNHCLNPDGKDTLSLNNSTNGLTISDAGNENVIAINYVQYLDIIDNSTPLLLINDVSPCINGVDFDAIPVGEEDVSPSAAPYECDEVKTWTVQAVDNCDTDLDITGELFANGILINEFNGASVSQVVQPNITYEVQFFAEDDAGNIGTSSLESTFFDCVQPIPILRGNKTFTLPASGMMNIFVSAFDHGSFDNCTDQSELAFKIWHASLGSNAPTNLEDILALPVFINFGRDNIGTNVVRFYIIDGAGNWSYAETTAIINDATNCNSTPFELPVTIFGSSCNNEVNCTGEKFWNASTNFATEPLTWSGKLYEDNVLVAEVNTNFVQFATQLDKEYRTEFTVTDACGNSGMETFTQDFSDCNQGPVVRLIDNLILNVDAKGVVSISAFSLDESTFDNCTSPAQLSYRIWHNSLGAFPQNIEAVNQLPIILTFDCNFIGTQIVHIFAIDDSGNFTSDSAILIIQDNQNVCGVPPNPCGETTLNVAGTLTIDSTYQAVNTITANAVINNNTDITFQAGQSITLNNGFHAVAGSKFIAKIESCSNTLQSLPIVEYRQTKNGKVESRLIEEVGPLANSKMILKVYPNPFQERMTIEYFLPTTSTITMHLFDLLGKRVQILEHNGSPKKGWQHTELTANNLPDGTYYLILQTREGILSKKVLLLK